MIVARKLRLFWSSRSPRLKRASVCLAFAQQFAETGVRVNTVAPGPFWTPLQSTGGQPQEKVMKFGEENAIGRPGQPVELAPVNVLLASEESSFATGQVYGASGGGGNP